MVKLVLLHKADSIYEDEPDVVYDFPRNYLKAIQEGGAIGSSTMSRSRRGHAAISPSLGLSGSFRSRGPRIGSLP